MPPNLALLRELRKTGMSLAAARAALVAANNDLGVAMRAAPPTLAPAVTQNGAIAAHATPAKAALVQILTNTDFAARTAEFCDTARRLAFESSKLPPGLHSGHFQSDLIALQRVLHEQIVVPQIAVVAASVVGCFVQNSDTNFFGIGKYATLVGLDSVSPNPIVANVIARAILANAPKNLADALDCPIMDCDLEDVCMAETVRDALSISYHSLRSFVRLQMGAEPIVSLHSV